MATRRTHGGPRQGAGRPPVDANGPRTSYVRVNLSAREKAEIIEAAGPEKAGAWIRRKILEILKRQKKQGGA